MSDEMCRGNRRCYVAAGVGAAAEPAASLSFLGVGRNSRMGDATGVVGLGFGVTSSLGAHLEPLRRTSRGPRAAPCSHPPFPPSLPSSRGEI